MVLGRSVEPQGIGFPLLIAPAYALGGANAVEAFLAAIAALGFVLAAAVGRRMVPEPWASGAALLVGLSPPALAHATAVYPEAAAGTALAGAALCALRVRERPGVRQRGRRRGAARRCCRGWGRSTCCRRRRSRSCSCAGPRAAAAAPPRSRRPR